MDLELYADRIIRNLLRLEEGDALSINTEDIDFHFAKIIAKKAAEITEVTVKTVVTENGRPVEVTDYDSEYENTPVKRPAMLRLMHVRKTDKDEKYLDIEVEKDDFAALHKLGHLSDPIDTERRISVPWCVVPVFEDPESDEAVEELKNIFDEKIEQNIRLADYRKSYMTHSDMDLMTFSADDCSLNMRIPSCVSFTGGSSVLADGRKFVSCVDFDRINVCVDKYSLNGTVSAKAFVFGKEEYFRLVFKDGLITQTEGSAGLEKLLSYDSELRRAGYISLRDKDFIISLGGGHQDSLDSSLKSVPSYFNTSLYSLKLHLNSFLSVHYSTFAGRDTELVRRGFFID